VMADGPQSRFRSSSEMSRTAPLAALVAIRA
jgi:hypothetical protein